jgi:hypothetical protein
MMNWLLFYFTTNTAACGGNKKARLSPRPICALPPPNSWQALRAAREGDQIPEKILIWCDFTPKSEPISQPNANLSRAACPPKGGRAPPAAPFAFF